MQVAQSLIDLAAEAPEDAPPAVLALAREARDALKPVTNVLETPAAVEGPTDARAA